MDNKRDGPLKVGDRVRHKQHSFTGTVVMFDSFQDPFPGATVHVHRDDAMKGSGYGDSWTCGSQKLELISPSTEPQAQEETRMKAYLWIAWKKNEDGKRAELVGDESSAWMVVAENEAEARRKADFKLVETLDLKEPDDITGYEVEVHPFGG